MAFRRRVTIVSGKPTSETEIGQEISIGDADSSETIETESAEGQRILIEAVRLLEKTISEQTRKKG